MKSFLKRIFFSIMFIGALYTTVSSISNVSAFDVMLGEHERVQLIYSNFSEHPGRKVKLLNKTYNKVNQRTRYISSEQIKEPQSIEEAIDFEQYPSEVVLATGYTAGKESTGKTPDHPEYGITFSGVKVKRDLYSTIAADLDVFPLGTILFIPGYGYGVVADKGSAIKGNKIDLYYPTVEDVYDKWGKKEVEVYVIKKGNGELTEEVLAELNETEALQVFREQYRES